MSLTKGQLIELLKKSPLPMDTPVSVYLQCTNDDEVVISTSLRTVEYDKHSKTVQIVGEYTDDYI